MTARRYPFAVLWLALACAALVGGVSCARSEPTAAVCGDTDAGTPVDPKLLAFLSRARSAHHLADQAELSENLERASEVLRGLVTGPVPGGDAKNAAPEVREVLADTFARIAELESQRGNFDQASKDIDAGLALARETTYFRGHLFEVRGVVEERRSKSLADAGKETEAAAAKKRALDAFEESMAIQAEVIKQAVPEDAP